MFKAGDSDQDDHIGYDDFYKMIIPSKPATTVRPSRAEFVEYYKKSKTSCNQPTWLVQCGRNAMCMRIPSLQKDDHKCIWYLLKPIYEGGKKC